MTRKPIKEVWLERVNEPVLNHGKILALQTCIVPRSMGYANAGRKTTLTARDCDEIVDAFDARVKRDGGPLVTEEQADIGRRWLAGMWARREFPDANYGSITHFQLHGFVSVDENAYRAIVVPEYDAFFPDGSILRYSAAAWVTANFDQWRWIREPK